MQLTFLNNLHEKVCPFLWIAIFRTPVSLIRVSHSHTNYSVAIANGGSPFAVWAAYTEKFWEEYTHKAPII